MQFQVPQFIDTQDKIIGSLTIKQFLALGGVGFVIFTLFLFLDFTLWVVVAFILGVIGSAAVFLKVNGRPMTVFLFSLFNYYWNPQLYLWQPTQPSADATKLYQLPKAPSLSHQQQITGSLKGLWNKLLTAKETIIRREAPLQARPSPARPQETHEQFKSAYEEALRRNAARQIDYRKG